MPAQAGIHLGFRELEENLDSCLRRNDERVTASILRVEL